ncbi:formyltransferase family protein [Christiangramia echinicola]|uniref:phosphoribosylglycinamide formyltransferase 1 n=1 Tax=Christiangramia echinicola TaxID=279359 RepID=A0A1H1L448_9FLAO|nr:formyltransferase family protein [Christiangramia echinicola]SDR69351.1 Folate-dependent phosphoribosylglycinamide formyltransferase PurN [Christiangramia echinicola]
MRTALLTSNSLRHKYLAQMLANESNLELIITEKKSPRITATDQYSTTDASFIKKHFTLRQQAEEKYFGDFNEFPSTSEIIKAEHAAINSSKIRKILIQADPDYIILFGTSIIGNDLLEDFPSRIINFHLGLSPYYKGSATNLFPYFYNEPECIGGTFHLASAKVDQGNILKQFRPYIYEDDDLHDIGNKVILQGGKLIPQILQKYAQDKIKPVKQESTGKVFRNKDLDPEKLRNIYLNFKTGMISEYLCKKKLRDKEKPIIH